MTVFQPREHTMNINDIDRIIDKKVTEIKLEGMKAIELCDGADIAKLAAAYERMVTALQDVKERIKEANQ